MDTKLAQVGTVEYDYGCSHTGTLLPPLLVILAVQRWCVQGLVGMEKA